MARTIEEILSEDLSWRETELGSLKLILARQHLSKSQRGTLLRASWALLYSHYEGFTKTALNNFYDFAARSPALIGDLPVETRAFSLGEDLKKLRNLPTKELMIKVETFSSIAYHKPPSFPEVDTQSNLWPKLLEDLLNTADIRLTSMDTHRHQLATLVDRRNDIAHGGDAIISDYPYYLTFESAVFDVLYELSYAIIDRLQQPPYV